MSGGSSSMSPKFANRFRNWMENHFGRGRRRGSRCELMSACRTCGRSPCRCGCAGGNQFVSLTTDKRHTATASAGRVVLTPDSYHSFSSPESAYFTGQSEDSGTPLTPATPITPVTPSSGKYFLLQNRDFRPRSASSCTGKVDSPANIGDRRVFRPTADSRGWTAGSRGDCITVEEFPEVAECFSPRERPRIKTNPWVSPSIRVARRSDTSGLDSALSAETVAVSRRVNTQRSYSSGRGSYFSDLSSGGTLARQRFSTECCSPALDSTYASLTSRPRSSTASCGSDADALPPPPVCSPIDSYSDNVTDDEDDTSDQQERRSPTKRSRGQRQRQERRRSMRDRRRGARLRPENESAGQSPLLPDPSSGCCLSPLVGVSDMSSGRWKVPGRVYENVGPVAAPRWRSARLAPSFCPSSEPLRRKSFRSGGAAAPGAPPPATGPSNSPRRLPADAVRPRSSLGSHPTAAEVVASPRRSVTASPLTGARQSPVTRSCRETLDQKVERLRRQRLIVEAKIEEAQAEEEMRRLERLRQLTGTLKQRRALLATGKPGLSSCEGSPFRQNRPVSSLSSSVHSPMRLSVTSSRTYFV